MMYFEILDQPNPIECIVPRTESTGTINEECLLDLGPYSIVMVADRMNHSSIIRPTILTFTAPYFSGWQTNTILSLASWPPMTLSHQQICLLILWMYLMILHSRDECNLRPLYVLPLHTYAKTPAVSTSSGPF